MTALGWRSGWFGIDAYGQETHGFADVSADRAGVVAAEIHWLAETGDVHTPFTLRHDPAAGSVELIAHFGEESEFDDDPDEDSGDSGDSVEDSTPVPADLAPLLAAGAPLDRAFSAMASLQPGMFSVLDDGADVAWDHHWLPGPGPGERWHPA